MQKEFSQKLSLQLVHYSQRRYGIDLTPEQADKYLQDLADVFLAFSGQAKTAEIVPRQDPNLSAPRVRGTKHAGGA